MTEQLPLYVEIRRSLEQLILSGKWPPGHRVPSEQELVEQFGCSRMTVNRAMGELAASGLVIRRRRSGTFVALPVSQKSVLKIQNIPEEVASEGREYRYEFRSRALRRATKRDAERLKVSAGDDVLAVMCLHYADGIPLIAEDRLINLAVVPQARDVDFSNIAPGSWLLAKVQWREAEHLIRATNATPDIARLLEIEANDACLVVERSTLLDTGRITQVELTYPGNRYQLTVRFNPSRDGE